MSDETDTDEPEATKPNETTDASVWVEGFCKRFGLIDTQGEMVTWFASAIEAGRSHAESNGDVGGPAELTSARDRIQELEATCDARDAALKDMRKQRDHWQQHRQSDDEAQAISECVKALDRFRDTGRHGSTGYGLTTYNSTSTVTYTNTSQVERVLRYLADRYGVTWYTPPPPSAPEVDAGELARMVVDQIQQTARLRP